MKYRNFLTVVFRFPFHKKKFIYSLAVCLLTAFFALPAAAHDNVQTDAGATKKLIKEAEKLTRKGELDKAEKILREIVERDSQDSKAKLGLSHVLLKQRRILEAYDLSFEIAKTEPKNSYAFAILGATLLHAGSFRHAQTAFINALKLNNQESLAWQGLGMLDFYENRITQGLESLREAVYLEPSEPDFLYALAQVSARAERYKEAAEAYKRFLQVSPQTDVERRDRIKGLINFLQFLGNRQSLYNLDGAKQTVVPVKLTNDRPVIQIRFQKSGEPLNFVLDTGSGISVISEETAQRMNIKPVTRGGLARGIGGDGKFEIVYGFLPSIHIGEVKIKNVPIYIRKFHMQNEQVDGYIGLSLISKFLTTLDYGDSTFTLINQNSIGEQPPETENLSLPLRLTSSGFLSGEVQLEGVQVPLNFIVDTGASVSVISDALANSKEISPFVKAEKMRVIGAAGITEDVSSFLLPRISFGTHSRKSITAVALDLNLINETSGFEQAGILGGNFLKNYRLTFDFQNSKVFFVPIK
jgi:Flp pilus assembly protein TadD/predicted aspartyl protease